VTGNMMTVGSGGGAGESGLRRMDSNGVNRMRSALELFPVECRDRCSSGLMCGVSNEDTIADDDLRALRRPHDTTCVDARWVQQVERMSIITVRHSKFRPRRVLRMCDNSPQPHTITKHRNKAKAGGLLEQYQALFGVQMSSSCLFWLMRTIRFNCIPRQAQP
jgi:hypothetical protein